MRSTSLSLALLLAALAGCAAAPSSPKAPSDHEPRGRREAGWYFERGQAAAHRGDTLRAEQYYSAALEKGHPRRRVLPFLLRACLRDLRLRSALNYALPELERRPFDVELRYLVATIHVALDQPEAARAELRRILRARSDHDRAHYLMGVVAADAFHDVEGAARHFSAYLSLSPEGELAASARTWLLDFEALSDRHGQRAPGATR